MIELLPCPFCGGKAERYSPNDGIGPWMTGCSNNKCYAAINSKALDNDYDGFSSQLSADEAWNTRHTPEGYVLVPSSYTNETAEKIFTKAMDIDQDSESGKFLADVIKVAAQEHSE